MPPGYIGLQSYPSLETYFNYTMYARMLPPVPDHCPTPMGTRGRRELPNVELVAEKLFKRDK